MVIENVSRISHNLLVMRSPMFVEMDVGGCDGENVTVGDLAVAELLLADKADRCVLGGDCSGDVATVDAVLELAD